MVDVVPGAAPQVAAATANLASAVLQAAPSGAQFRVTVMPGYLARDYIEVLSEAKITAVTDPATNLTTAAVSLSYNPFAMKGGRGSAIWRTAVKTAKCGGKYRLVTDVAGMGTASGWLWTDDDDTWAKHVNEDLGSSMPAGFSQDIKAIEGVRADARKKQRAAIEEKSQIASKELAVRQQSDALAAAENEFQEALVALAEASGTDKATLAIAVSQGRVHRDDVRGALQRAQHARDMVEVTYEGAQAAALAADTARDAVADKVVEHWKQALTKCFDENVRVEFWRELDATWVPQIMTTVGYDFYPGGMGPNPLDKTGMTIAPLEPWGGTRAELSILFRPHELFEFELSAQARRVRPNGAPYTQLANYEGGGVTVAWMVWTALRGVADRASNADYRKSGALPGVVLGLSGQSLRCDGFTNCANGQITGESLTPFVDVKVLNAAQFRFSLPMKWSQSVLTNTFTATPTFSTAGAFAGL